MRNVIKRIAGIVLIPVTRWYLRKPRRYSYQGISIVVNPGVFHPGIFHSTLFLLEYLGRENLKGKSFLELGCGSGLISLFAHRQGAVVTASDINPQAIQNTVINQSLNHVRFDTILSDLFDSISQRFDLVVVNPPYYQKESLNDAERAWHAGAKLEYFQKLFDQVPHHTHHHSKVLMVLTAASPLHEIKSMAHARGVNLTQVAKQKRLFDGWDFIFELSSQHPADP